MTTTEGIALTIGDLRQVIPMAFPDPSVEERFRARIKSADDQSVRVRISSPDESDVEGHAFGATLKSVWVKVQLDEDDTEGHAISVHFPTADEADKFRKRLMAAGLMAGAVVLGSVGAIAVSNLPATSDVTAPARTAVYERPAGVGMLEGVDAGAGAAAIGAAAASGIDAATGKPARSGFLEGADATGSAAIGAAAASGIDAATGKPARSGFLQGADAAGMGAAAAAATTVDKSTAVQGTEAGAPSDEASAGSGSGALEGVDR